MIPVKCIQNLLGNTTAKMTLDTYAGVMSTVKFGALDSLDKIGKKEHNKNIENEN